MRVSQLKVENHRVSRMFRNLAFVFNKNQKSITNITLYILLYINNNRSFIFPIANYIISIIIL